MVVGGDNRIFTEESHTEALIWIPRPSGGGFIIDIGIERFHTGHLSQNRQSIIKVAALTPVDIDLLEADNIGS